MPRPDGSAQIAILAKTFCMQYYDGRTLWRWIIIAASFIIVALILLNTYAFFQIFKNEERIKMELWAQSLKTIDNADLETDDIELPRLILSQNSTIPIIMTQQDTIVNLSNIPAEIEADSVRLAALLEKLKKENDPILIEYAPGEFQYVNYGNSSLLNKLKYYPVALLLIMVLFATVVYYFYRSTKISTQNKLWAGMAKETAHQIGTPLSSLIGWLEIMKADEVDPVTIAEIEKDVVRLQTIADRFSKIGSEPLLEPLDIIAETRQSYDYLQSRFSNNVKFSFSAPADRVTVMANPVLHSWTVENLVKNAIDAMKGRGSIEITITCDARYVRICVTDTGKGIAKNNFKRVFEPGFTTKKRGWGLGLSLTKRIVEAYHKGRIRVLHSELNKGTVIQVSLPRQQS